MSKTIHQYNITQIADMFGFHRDTLRKRFKGAGLRASGRDGNADLYLLSEAGPAVFGGTGSSVVGVDPDSLQPTDRRAWFQSENERLKFEVEVGQLCLDEEVRIEMANLVKPMLAELEVLPDLLERDCGLSPKAVKYVQDKIDDIRNSMAERMSN